MLARSLAVVVTTWLGLATTPAVHAESSDTVDDTVGSSCGVRGPMKMSAEAQARLSVCPGHLSYKDSALRSPYCNVALHEEVDCLSGNIVRYHHIGDVYVDGRDAIFTWETPPQIRAVYPGPVDFQAGERGVSVVDLRTGKVRSFALPRRPGVYKTMEEIAPVPPHIVRAGFADDGAAYLAIGDDGKVPARYWFHSHRPIEILSYDDEPDPQTSGEHRLEPLELEAYEDEPSGVRTFPSGTAAATCRQNFASLTSTATTTRVRLIASCVEHASQYLTIDASTHAPVQARTMTTCQTSACLVQQFAGFNTRCENAPVSDDDNFVVPDGVVIDGGAVSTEEDHAGPTPNQYYPFEVALSITLAISANWFIGPEAQTARQAWINYFAAL